jgi:hypothetical protein
MHACRCERGTRRWLASGEQQVVLWMRKEREEEKLQLYHVRIIEGAKDIHMVYYNKVHVQGANKKTYTYC